MKTSKKGVAVSTGIAENLKKGITEMLILAFLNHDEMTINEVVKRIDEHSDGMCKVVFPYATIYRLLDNGHIAESEKRVADNRRRQFYKITDSGKLYFEQMRNEYMHFISGVDTILHTVETKKINE